jgi:hypothetical protein
MDRAGFDPRYSPEFQRGFDPAVHEGPPAAAESPERMEPVPEPVVRRIPPAPTAAVPGPTAAARTEDITQPFGDETGDEPVLEALPLSPWRNPYLVALTVLGVVLVAGGIGAFRWAVSQVYGGAAYEGGATQEEMADAMLAAQLAWGLSPLLALAGVLTLVGVFFFVAWRWRPRPVLAEYEPDPAQNGSRTT